MLKSNPTRERFSRLALLESTGPVASSLLLSGFSITLPSNKQRMRFPCP